PRVRSGGRPDGAGVATGTSFAPRADVDLLGGFARCGAWPHSIERHEMVAQAFDVARHVLQFVPGPVIGTGQLPGSGRPRALLGDRAEFTLKSAGRRDAVIQYVGDLIHQAS